MLDTPAEVPRPAGASTVERAAYIFYVVAALGSSIGQVWVGVEVPPWPPTLPLWVRALLVLPFALVIELGGAVASGFADTRRRLGETAYGWRVLSAASVALAVGINVVGHAGSPYLAVVFGGLGVFAYTVWLLHSAARRRDALRATGKLRTTAPAYGLVQWVTQPGLTRRARLLAIEHGYGLVQSLTAARTQIATAQRRAALAASIKAEIKSQHQDPVLAALAVTTAPVDEVADALMQMIDAEGWANALYRKIDPPTPPLPIVHSEEATDPDPDDYDVADDEDEETTGSAKERMSGPNAVLNTTAEDMWIEAAESGIELTNSKLLALFNERYPATRRSLRWAALRCRDARERLRQKQMADTSA
ncbi:hypothetical protein [Hamadaea tsunoensis]|uniref:hypothetical protein n=1 Tax=Hamadaea tsunoensis TaxID=53368 RepID=UPI00040384E8|nr:hypothetical protein [Hamadaea tsunoensis]